MIDQPEPAERKPERERYHPSPAVQNTVLSLFIGAALFCATMAGRAYVEHSSHGDEAGRPSGSVRQTTQTYPAP